MDSWKLVPKYYRMDPDTEDLLANGNKLKEGMVVLVEDPMHREEVNIFMDEARFARALKWNRWCTITELTYAMASSPLVRFVAVYDDGTKSKMSLSSQYAWYVKLESIPQEGNVDADESE